MPEDPRSRAPGPKNLEAAGVYASREKSVALELTERRAGKTIVLVPQGNIDLATAPQFQEKLMPLMSAGSDDAQSVVLDFSSVDYISSAGLRVLMIAAKEARKSGRKIAVAALQPIVREIFQISRFTEVLPCHTDVTTAIAALGSPA
jgi:anti-anti-sigma factor